MSYPAGPSWAPAPPYQSTPPDRPHSQSTSASHGPPVPPASTRPSRHVPEQAYPGPQAYAYAQPQYQPQWQPQPQPQPQLQAGPSQWSSSPGYASHSVESAMGDFGRMNLDGRSRDDESHSGGYVQSRQVSQPSPAYPQPSATPPVQTQGPHQHYSPAPPTRPPSYLPPRVCSAAPPSSSPGPRPARLSSLITNSPNPASLPIPLAPPPDNALPTPTPSSPTSLTFPLPTTQTLALVLPSLDSRSDRDRLIWAGDVLRVLDRLIAPPKAIPDFIALDSPPPAPDMIPEALNELLNSAIPIIISFTTHSDNRLAALASYLQAKLLATGSCPEFLPRDPRQAFKDYEIAARGGEARAWFRLGRDYEVVGDSLRARDCYERGRANGDCECTYRMGMARLLGQLGLSPDPTTALPILELSAESCSIDFPQPSYVYGMLLSSELSLPVPLSPSLIIPQTSSQTDALFAQNLLARDYIERSAYLCHPPAAYKCGVIFEHASLGAAYDPQLSVKWYSLASQMGETEADMALSKWFLCGAEGCFGKNEELARTFADKAASKGHPNGCFAMGYYLELGIGGPKDTEQAKKWYRKAARLNNTDAAQRLAALEAPVPSPISLLEHEQHVNATLVRRRTQAKIRSDRNTISRPARRRPPGTETLRVETDPSALAQRAYTPPTYPGTSTTTTASDPISGYGHVPMPVPMPSPPGSTSSGHPSQPMMMPVAMPMPTPQAAPVPIPQTTAHRQTYTPSSRPGSYHTPTSQLGSSAFHLATPSPPRSRNGDAMPAPRDQSLLGRSPQPGHRQPQPQPQPQPHPQSQALPTSRPTSTVYSHSHASRPSGNGSGPVAGHARVGGYVLQDSLVPELPPPEVVSAQTQTQTQTQTQAQTAGKQSKHKGPQTFAEMGFVSKPVEEEGCVVM